MLTRLRRRLRGEDRPPPLRDDDASPAGVRSGTRARAPALVVRGHDAASFAADRADLDDLDELTGARPPGADMLDAGDPGGAGGGPATAAHGGAAQLQLVDPMTRTYWNPSAPRAQTLVEAAALPQAPTIGDRVAALMRAHDRRLRERSELAVERAAGTSDPAFLEMLMVEMLRAGRLERAWLLLAPDCRLRWRGPARFAAAHRDLPEQLGGVEVVEVDYEESWTDPVWGRTHHDVAALQVEYTLNTPAGPITLPRTVHQVRLGDRWHVLLYPPAPERAAASRDDAPSGD